MPALTQDHKVLGNFQNYLLFTVIPCNDKGLRVFKGKAEGALAFPHKLLPLSKFLRCLRIHQKRYIMSLTFKLSWSVRYQRTHQK